jgi:membrane protein
LATHFKKIKVFWSFLKKLVHYWSHDRVSSKAAALAYYTLFSLAPILLICISIIGAIFGEEAARGQILEQVGGLVGKDSALQIQGIIQNLNKPTTLSFSSIISGIVLLFTASGVFVEIQDGLNDIWGIKTKSNKKWLATLKSRFLPYLMILIISFLLLVSLILSACLALIGAYLDQYGNTNILIELMINHVLSFFIITFLFAMIFKVLPDIVLTWRDVWFGALITSLLFSLGKILIGFYITQFHIFSAFGVAGFLIIILVWVFYSSQILFIGAEITKILYIKKDKKITPTKYGIKKNRNSSGTSS